MVLPLASFIDRQSYKLSVYTTLQNSIPASGHTHESEANSQRIQSRVSVREDGAFAQGFIKILDTHSLYEIFEEQSDSADAQQQEAPVDESREVVEARAPGEQAISGTMTSVRKKNGLS